MVKQASPVMAWYRACRPFSLSASIVPVIVGSALAAKDGEINIFLFALTLLGAVSIQIGTNLADEYSDHVRSAYKSKFPAPHKVISSGLLSPSSVRMGAFLSLGIAGLIGLYFVSVAGWPILLIGLTSIAAGYFYSAGRTPLGNLGMGEPLVFLFMGPVAVLSTYYIQVRQLSVEAIVISIPVACLVTNILIANNLRDVGEDREAGKVSIATLYGRRVAATTYCSLTVVAFGTVIAAVALDLAAHTLLTPLLALPLGVFLTRQVWQTERNRLHRVVRGSALFHLLFGVLLAVGIMMAKVLSW